MTLACEPGDVCLLGREIVVGLDRSLPWVFAGGK